MTNLQTSYRLFDSRRVLLADRLIMQQECYNGRTSRTAVDGMDARRRALPREQCPWKELIDWLEGAMHVRGISAADIASATDLAESTLSGLLNCKHRPSLETLEKLAAYFSVDRDFLEGLAGRKSKAGPLPGMPPLTEVSGVWLVPIVGEVSAGGGFTTQGVEYVAPIQGASRQIVSFHVRGDCMAPRIEDGDRVIVDLARAWRDGSIVLARVGDELVVKRAYRENKHIRLKADAPGYADIVDHDVQIYGVVIRIEKTPE